MKGGVFDSILKLSEKTSELTQAVDRAHNSSRETELRLTEILSRADNATKNLEFLLASLHDLPGSEVTKSEIQKKEQTELSEAYLFVRRP